MALITDQPEDLPSSNALDGVDDPDHAPQYSGERAEIYLSGAHVCTLEDAPENRQRITLMVDVEVTEEAVRANGDEDVPIRKVRRIGDMYLPGTKRPPTSEELKAIADAAKLKAAAEKAAQEDAERAEKEHNEPPMFDEEGDPIDPDNPDVKHDAEVAEEHAAAEAPVDIPPFSDKS